MSDDYQLSVEFYQRLLEIVRANPDDEDLVEQLAELRKQMEIEWLEMLNETSSD